MGIRELDVLSGYRPVPVGSAIYVFERFLLGLGFRLFPGNPTDLPPGQLADQVIQRAWGDKPEMEQRLNLGNMLSFLPVVFGTPVLIVSVLIAVVAKAPTVGIFGAALAVAVVSLAPVHLVRRTFAARDARRWEQAGRPENWVPSILSQPKNRDIAYWLILAISTSWILLASL